jgi:hypothetical protein
VIAAASLSDVTPLIGATAALIAAIGGVRAAFLGVSEYRLKSKAQRVEIDVQLSKLLADLVPIANGRGGAVVSEAAAETIARSQVEQKASPSEMKAALKGAVVTMPVGEAMQATAITSIGYLGGAHEALNAPARQALHALDFVTHPELRAARKLALELVEGA